MVDANTDRMAEWRRGRLVELLNAVDDRDGARPTAIEGVEYWRRSTPMSRRSVVYQPKVVIVAQGSKRGYLGDQVYHYDADNCLVLSVPLPFEAETIATPAEPLLALTIAADPAMLGELLLEMENGAAPHPADNPAEMPRGIYSAPLTAALSDAAIRLAECLLSPLDARILGRQAAREVLFRVLQGEQGAALRGLTHRGEFFTRIARIMRHLHTEYATPITTEALARRAGMSVSTFHQNFKQVTATSPLQYLKQIRLHRALALMAHDGHNAGTAAALVGYESPSQFGREFKRLFGASPVEEAMSLRQKMIASAPERATRRTPLPPESGREARSIVQSIEG